MRGSAVRSLRKLVFGAVVVVAGPAVAADATMVADALVATLVADTRTASYQQATAVGEVVTITGFAFEDTPNGVRGAVTEIIVTNPVEREGGGFRAESVILNGGNYDDDANRLLFDHVEIFDVLVPPAADDTAEADRTVPLARLVATGLSFVPPQANPLAIEQVELTLGRVADGVPYAISVAVTGIEIPLSLADNSTAIAILRSLGFESLYLSFNVAGAFDADADTLTIESLGIAIRDFGNVDVAAVLTGVALGRLAEPGGVEIVLGNALVNSVQIRFENGGAMQAFFRAQAAATGVPEQDVAFGLAAAFQIFLRILENPTLEQQIGRAVGTFLRDPKTITMVATPPAPVFLAEIIGLIVTAPMALPLLLGMVVTASE